MRVHECYSLPQDRFFAQESWPVIRRVTVIGSLRSGQGPGQGQGPEPNSGWRRDLADSLI